MRPATAFDDRVVVSIAKRRRFDPRTLRALFKAREALALSLGLLLAKVRETADPVQGLMVCLATITSGGLRHTVSLSSAYGSGDRGEGPLECPGVRPPSSARHNGP
jgi:hypothetical protein